MPIRYLDEEPKGRIRYLDEEPEMDALSQASAAAGQFAEGAFGVGDEAGAIGRMLGGSVYDIMNSDKDLSSVFKDNFQWDRSIDATREQMEELDEANPLLANAATGAGMVSGMALPIGVVGKGASLGKAAKVGAGTGAAYGFLGGEDEGRVGEAVFGLGLGAALGAGGQKLVQKLASKVDDKAAGAADEAEVFLEAAEEGGWTDVGGKWGVWEEYATGVSDGIRRKISPEVGGRLQRADETAMRRRTLETAEYVENADMQRVIRLAEDDEKFKGMVLDFARDASDQGTVLKYINDTLDGDAAKAAAKYFRWAETNNAKYNKQIGGNQSATKYMHTQKARGLPGSKPLAKKESATDYVDFFDDDLNMPVDQATKARDRGLYMKGEVKPSEYANPFLTNTNRIFNNQRLLEIQQKFGIESVNGGADGLMRALEKKIQQKGISAEGARDARNAIAKLIKGQNKSANAWIKSLQNSGYSVLAGPKTVLLNFHDIPVALWNNGVKSARGLVNNVGDAASVKRLGIDGQNVGEFVQQMRNQSTKKSWRDGTLAEAITRGVTDKAMTLGGFSTADRIAKNGVLRTVVQDTKDRVTAGNLRQRWGTFFDASDMDIIERAVKKTGGDVSKMSTKEQKLYDELLTLGLGQQQLISAAGRPPAWLNNPNFRPVWMMRGFAIKHNALLAERVVKKLKNGDKAGAAKEAATYLALPGSGFAAMNVGRNEMFKEDYEGSGEEFVYSLLDSVLGPVTLNTVGLGSSYERSEWERSPATALSSAVLPPLGLYGDVVDGVGRALIKQDMDEMSKIVTEHPLYKQWSAAFD